nr:AAA family ATPase [uncultured Pseudomonas sp.]
MTSLHADEAFLDHYHFTHDPFASRVPGFKFFPAQRKPVLGQLHHLARYSQLLLVVAGPEGSGKTLLRQALVASTNKQAVHTVVVSAQGAEDPASLFRQVAQGLHIQRFEPQAILAQVAQMALTGQETYLLVDDAEQLSDAALTGLLGLAAGNGEGRLHVFLFAEPELGARLEVLADGEECFHIIDLLPYTEEETREYLTQRLEGAGQGLEVFSDGQLSSIDERGEGWPGKINQVAREILIDNMLAQRSMVRRAGFAANLPKKHLLALVVVVVGVLAAWLMQGREAAEVAIPAPSVEPQQPAPVAAQQPAAGDAPAIEFAGTSQPLPLPLVGEAQPVIREPLAQAAGMAGVEEADVAGASADDAIQQPQAVTPPAQVPVAPVVAPVEVVPVPVPAPAPIPKPQPVAPTKPAVVAQADKPAVGADWYRTQAASRYTLQILGARAESSAQTFVREHGAQYRYFKKQHQGRPLYVVTYGSFATRQEAQVALQGLPASVQAGKPWPRTFASIRQELVSTP